MNSSHSIESAQLKDAVEIARLSVELGYPTTAEATRRNLESLLDSARHFVAVAPAPDGTLLGWLVAERRLWLESGEGVEITGLVVSAASRRLGVGKALVAAAGQWAASQGFPVVRVRSNVTRAESHAFYQSIGFVAKKTQRCYEKYLVPIPLRSTPSQ